MTALADVVIVNWNSGPMLRECVESVLQHRTGVGRIIVVDNGSADGSASMPYPVASQIDIISAKENLGFAKACNLGAERCQSPYILFLNPDARLMEDSVDQVTSFLESSDGESYGICGIKLVGNNGKIQRHCANFTNASTYLGNALGLSNRFPRLFTPHFMSDFDHLQSRQVDQVIGAFFLVRRSLFIELGGFDERYFVYFEEVDFSLRARRAGHLTYYLADTTAYHYGGGTSEKVVARRLYYSLRSRLRYARRHFSLAGLVLTTGVTLFLEPFSRIAKALLRGSATDVRHVFQAYRLLGMDLLRHSAPRPG